MSSMRIVAYVHALTGEKYPASEWINHGYGGLYRGMNDLPKDGYPYRVIMSNK